MYVCIYIYIYTYIGRQSSEGAISPPGLPRAHAAGGVCDRFPMYKVAGVYSLPNTRPSVRWIQTLELRT